MKRMISALISIAVALVTATTIASVVWAMTYVSEANLYYVFGGTSVPVTYSSSGCAGGSCRYLNQSSSNPGIFRWAYAPTGIYDWWAYCPTIGWAAAEYNLMYEVWSTIMNQSNPNNQGKYVYLGRNDVSASEALYTSNKCITG